MIRFTEFSSRFAARGMRREMTFEDLCEYFDTFEIGPPGGKCFVPGIYSGRRLEVMTALVVEFNRGDDPEPIKQRLIDLSIHFILYPAHSHTKEHPRFCVLIPFAEPLPVVHPDVWVKLVWPRLIQYFHFERAEPYSDRYETPRKPHADLQHETAFTGDGFEFFRWQEVVGDLIQPIISLTIEQPARNIEDALLHFFASTKIATKPFEQEDPTREIDFKDLKGRLLKYDSRLARKMVRAQILTPLRDERSIEIAWRWAIAALASVAYDWESTTKLLQVCVPCLEKMTARGDRLTRDDLKEMLLSARLGIPEARAARAQEKDLKDMIDRLAAGEVAPEAAIEGVNRDPSPADLH